MNPKLKQNFSKMFQTPDVIEFSNPDPKYDLCLFQNGITSSLAKQFPHKCHEDVFITVGVMENTGILTNEQGAKQTGQNIFLDYLFLIDFILTILVHIQ